MPEFQSRSEKWFWYALVGCATVVVIGIVVLELCAFEIVGAFVEVVRAFGLRGAIVAVAVLLVFILVLWYLGQEE